jgi:uncharacterized phage protein (TIGR02216 family)
MMQLGLGVLRLSPRDFWAATPREIAAAFASHPAAGPMDRRDLDDLINRFPDVP